MIEFSVQDNVCRVSGTLEQHDVVSLWPVRQGLFPDEVDTLELSALSYSDSAGIAFLLALWRQRLTSGQSLCLTQPSEQLSKLVELYDLQACFNLQA
ncbi:MAG: STAS domain-containing protein [Shewanella sp.]|nr:STAS domain-containing protein [Shewanella sp.]MCF1429381.1 STAS domain-containing protein [Shewanella sp.]MCF1438940.1 STAS domain-containing protein [Shewanella sp.]MCF1456047.1 STAS domain-containing protein [Shewanella sp.]